jgi:TonB-linked SusC/RagA family outer membrane protein
MMRTIKKIKWLPVNLQNSRFLQLAFALLIGLTVNAQERVVTGKVTDEKTGSPLNAANVEAKGSKAATRTDASGTFTLTIGPKVNTLVISYLGYERQEIAVGAGAYYSITLTPVGQKGDEVLVVGYGTQRKKDATASISTIGSASIRNIPAQSFDQLLAGKAAGLNVVIPNGVLNNPPVLRIRGINTISGNTSPLIIIDGVPAFTGDVSTNLSANNALAGINPSDIDDITILKDAAASAIYGSRAANGVMLVTTKKGKLGKAKVTYDAWVGWTEAFNVFDVLRADDYVTLKNEAVKNANYAIPASGLIPGLGLVSPAAGQPIFFMDNINGQNVDTRWADYVYQTGIQHNHSLSISGANQGTKYYFSANYSKQEGILQTNTFDRKQMRMNIEQKVNDWLKIGANLNFSRGTTLAPNSGSLPGTPFNTGGAARLAFVTAPNVSPFLPDGSYNYIGNPNIVYAGQVNQTLRNSFNQIGRGKNLDRSGFYNPAMIRDLNIISSVNDQLVGDINAEAKIIKGLTYRFQYSANYLTTEDKSFYNSFHGDGIQTTALTDDGRAFNVVAKNNIVNVQNTLTYDKTIKNDHNFNLLAGSEEISNKTDRWGASRSGLTETFYNEFQGGFSVNDNPVGNALTENYLLSFFGRLNYNYKNRYYISGNLRRDGYSAFSEGKKWGNFSGVSLGWNLSDESFFAGKIRNIFSTLKLRGSYGTIGSLAAVGNFASLSSFSSGLYGAGYSTLFYSQAGNKNLTWETSNKTDIGFDFGLFNDRITGEFSYYKTDLSDLIINVPTPPSMGIPGNSIQANSAAMYNKGIELNINAAILKRKDLSISTYFNISTLKNQVTSLANGVPQIVGTSQLENTNMTRPGYSIGSFFVVKSKGVDAATGRRIFVNAAGQDVYFDFSALNRYQFADGSTAPAIDASKDGYMAGNALPKVYGGWGANVTYKGFDMNIDLIYSYGNKVYFGSRAGLLDQRFWNNMVDVKRRWQKPGDVTDIPKLIYNDNISNGSAFPIDANLFDGGFVKCRNISLGYTLPKTVLDLAKISNIRLYTQLQNPFTITKYPGSDPEISVNGNSALTPGVDRNTIGQSRTITIGINVTF